MEQTYSGDLLSDSLQEQLKAAFNISKDFDKAYHQLVSNVNLSLTIQRTLLRFLRKAEITTLQAEKLYCLLSDRHGFDWVTPLLPLVSREFLDKLSLSAENLSVLGPGLLNKLAAKHPDFILDAISQSHDSAFETTLSVLLETRPEETWKVMQTWKVTNIDKHLKRLIKVRGQDAVMECSAHFGNTFWTSPKRLELLSPERRMDMWKDMDYTNEFLSRQVIVSIKSMYPPTQRWGIISAIKGDKITQPVSSDLFTMLTAEHAAVALNGIDPFLIKDKDVPPGNAILQSLVAQSLRATSNDVEEMIKVCKTLSDPTQRRLGTMLVLRALFQAIRNNIHLKKSFETIWIQLVDWVERYKNDQEPIKRNLWQTMVSNINSLVPLLCDKRVTFPSKNGLQRFVQLVKTYEATPDLGWQIPSDMFGLATTFLFLHVPDADAANELSGIIKHGLRNGNHIQLPDTTERYLSEKMDGFRSLLEPMINQAMEGADWSIRRIRSQQVSNLSPPKGKRYPIWPFIDDLNREMMFNDKINVRDRRNIARDWWLLDAKGRIGQLLPFNGNDWSAFGIPEVLSWILRNDPEVFNSWLGEVPNDLSMYMLKFPPSGVFHANQDMDQTAAAFSFVFDVARAICSGTHKRTGNIVKNGGNLALNYSVKLLEKLRKLMLFSAKTIYSSDNQRWKGALRGSVNLVLRALFANPLVTIDDVMALVPDESWVTVDVDDSEWINLGQEAVQPVDKEAFTGDTHQFYFAILKQLTRLAKPKSSLPVLMANLEGIDEVHIAIRQMMRLCTLVPLNEAQEWSLWALRHLKKVTILKSVVRLVPLIYMPGNAVELLKEVWEKRQHTDVRVANLNAHQRLLRNNPVPELWQCLREAASSKNAKLAAALIHPKSGVPEQTFSKHLTKVNRTEYAALLWESLSGNDGMENLIVNSNAMQPWVSLIPRNLLHSFVQSFLFRNAASNKLRDDAAQLPRQVLEWLVMDEANDRLVLKTVEYLTKSANYFAIGTQCSAQSNLEVLIDQVRVDRKKLLADIKQILNKRQAEEDKFGYILLSPLIWRIGWHTDVFGGEASLDDALLYMTKVYTAFCPGLKHVAHRLLKHFVRGSSTNAINANLEAVSLLQASSLARQIAQSPEQASTLKLPLALLALDLATFKHDTVVANLLQHHPDPTIKYLAHEF